jgi:hypothetical protein
VLDCASDQSGDFLERACRNRLVGDFSAPAQDNDAIRHAEDILHAVADEDDRNALVAQQADQIEDLGDLT